LYSAVDVAVELFLHFDRQDREPPRRLARDIRVGLPSSLTGETCSIAVSCGLSAK